MYVSNWLSTWRAHLFGADAEIDYDTFVTGPRQRHEVPCRVCGSRCDEARAIIATSPGDEPPMLIDRFACPHRASDWHQRAHGLVVQIESTPSLQRRRLLWADLDMILRQQHMPWRRD